MPIVTQNNQAFLSHIFLTSGIGSDLGILVVTSRRFLHENPSTESWSIPFFPTASMGLIKISELKNLLPITVAINDFCLNGKKGEFMVPPVPYAAEKTPSIRSLLGFWSMNSASKIAKLRVPIQTVIPKKALPARKLPALIASWPTRAMLLF